MPPFKPTTPDAFGIDPNIIKKPGSALLDAEIEFFTAPELAKALEVEERIVRRMIERHAVNTYKVAGKLLFRRTDILAYLELKEEPGTDSAIPSHAMVIKTYARDWSKQLDAFDDLSELIGFTIERNPKTSELRWAIVEGRMGKVFLVQREYRDGIGFITYPTEENLARYRESPWMAWNEAKILRC